MDYSSWFLEYSETYMKEALGHATSSASMGEVPVGAVIVEDGVVIAAAGNCREASSDPTGHAEIIAIQSAARRKGEWRLTNCDLYVTLEPCLMCAGAIVNSRLRGVFFGSFDPKAGALLSLFGVGNDPRLNHEFHRSGGHLAAESSELLKSFFQMRRV
ncbi:MAG: nucleoside deaminase [Actinomycetota bacterium]|nr:nucleoside deaminase [Actinomycetota bacterium]